MKTTLPTHLLLRPCVWGRLFLFTFLLSVGFAQVGKATVYTWNGSVSNDWGNIANWTTSPTSFSTPSSNDEVIFPSGNNIACYIPSNATVYRMTIQGGYGGTIIASGNLRVVFFFGMSGGVFFAPSNMVVDGSFSVTGGIFYHNNGTIRMEGAGNSTLTVSSSANLYNLTINKSSSDNVTLSSGNTLTVANNFTVSSGTFNASNGSLVMNNLVQGGGTTFTAPSGIMRISGNIDIDEFAIFQHNNGTVELNGGTATIEIEGSNNFFYNLKINKTNTDNILKYFLVVVNDLELINGNLQPTSSTNEPTNAIYARGNVFFYDSYDSAAGLTSRLVMNGSGAQSITPSGAVIYYGNIENKKTSGTTIITSSGTNVLEIEASANFIFTAGKVELQGEFIIGASAGIMMPNASRYFITTGAGKLSHVYTGSGFFNFPVGSATRYAPVGIMLSGATTLGVAYIPAPTTLPANTMQTGTNNNLVRRSVNEVWDMSSSVASVGIEPYMYVSNATASNISNPNNLEIAIKNGTSDWFSFQNEDLGRYTAYSASPINGGLSLPTLYGFGDVVAVGSSFYLTYGSRTTADNFLGTNGAQRVTNCKDAIPISVATNTNVSVSSNYLAGGSAVSCYVSNVVASQWYEFTGTGEVLKLTYQNTSSFTTLELFSGGCDALTSLGCGTATTFMAGAYINLFFNTNAGETYKIRLATTSLTATGILRIEPIPAPVIIAPVLGDATDNSFVAKWNAVSEATDYQIEIFQGSNFGNVYVSVPSTSGLTNYTVLGLIGGTTYHYRVRAIFASGASSDYSSMQSITVVPPAPTLTVDNSKATSTSFKLIFPSPPTTGATHYLLTITEGGVPISYNQNGTIQPFQDISPIGIVNEWEIKIGVTLTPNTKYQATLKAANAMGNSAPITVDAWTAPSAPTSLQVVMGTMTSTGYLLSWNASDGGADVYEIFIDGASYGGTTATSYFVTSAPNTTYDVRVRAVNTTLTPPLSSVEAILSVTTLPLPPNQPNSLTLTNATANGFDASWTDGGGATSYEYQVAIDAGFSTIVLSGSTNFTSVTPIVTGGQIYYFRVRAVNSGGESGYVDSSIDTPPAPPIAYDATGFTANSFIAQWQAVGGATEYRLDVSTDVAFGVGTFVYENLLVPSTNTTQTVTVTDTGIMYYYQVRTVKGVDISGNSNAITVLPAPAGLNITDNKPDGFTVNWTSTPPAGAEYRVFVATSSAPNIAVFTGSSSSSPIIVSGLSGCETYNVSLYAVSSLAPIAPIGFLATTTSFTLPATPTLNAITDITDTGVTFTWNAVSCATSYTLRYDLQSNFFNSPTIISGIAGTSQNITGLLPNTSYDAELRAVNADGSSYPTTRIKFTTKLTTPTLLPASNIQHTQFTANWVAVAGADYYRLDVNTTQDFKGTTIVNNQQVNTNSYEVLNVNAGTIYYYQVRAIVEVSEGSEVASINPATPQMVITKPLALPATAISTVGFTANWQWVHGVDAMALEISTSNTFGTFVTNYPETFTSNTIAKNVTSLTPFITYYYRLKATKGVVEIYSNTVEVRTLPTPPVLLPPTNITTNSFKANWNFVAGATAYYLDVATDSGFSNIVPPYQNLNTGVADNFPVTGLTAGNTYYYRLRAGGGTTISNSSEVDTLITTPSLPTAVSATSTSPTDLTVAWSHTGIGVDGYRIRLVEFPSLNQVASDDITALSYNFTNLDNTKEYRVFVKAYNADSETGEVFRNALLKPTANGGDNINATGFKATWNAIAGVTNWTLQWDTNVNFTSAISIPVNTNEYVFNTLSAGNTYYYRVFATSGSVVSPVSNEITVVIPAIPAVPTALSPLVITTSSFEARWTQVAGCDGYEIDIYKNNTYQSTETAIGANTLTKTISNLPNNSLYTYKVRAYIGNVKSNDSNGIDVFLVPTALEEDTYASGGTGTGFTAKWTTVAVPSSHRLDLFEETPYGSNTYVPVAAYTNIDAGIGGSFPLTDLKFGTNYKYVIRATNGTVTSPNSNEIFALTLPQSPLIDVIVDTTITATSFSLDWATNPSQSATGYALQVFAKGNPVPFYDGYNVGNATSFTLGNTPNPPLSPNTHYLVRLRAVNASGNSSVSGQADVLTLPTTTTATTATEVRYDFTSSSLQFKANWLDDAKGTGDGVITGYKVDVSTDNTFATGVTTITSPTVGLVVNSTNLPTLTGNTVYYYRVKASNASGDALTDSNVMSVLTVPNAPLNVQTTNVQSDKFTVLIPTPTIPNVTSYVLDVATTNNFAPNTYKVINETLNASLVGYTVSNLEAGKLYYYRMRAVNASGASNYSTVRSIITTPVALPAPIDSITTDAFDAQWQEVVGADSYMLQISTQENFATIFDSIPVLAGNAVLGIETKKVNSNLAYLGNYYYRVRAIKNGVSSEYSNVINVKLAPDAPVALPLVFGASTNQATETIVKWNFVAGANAYYLDVARVKGAGDALSNFVSGYNNQLVNVSNSFPVTGLKPDSTYYFRVRAANSGSPSASSNVITFQTSPTLPTLGAVTVASATVFTIEINHAQKATLVGFEIKLIDVTDSNNPVVKYIDDAVPNTATQYVFTAGKGVEGGKQYSVELRAKNTAQYSAWVTTVNNILTKPKAPVALSVALSDRTQNSFVAKWKSVPTATKYYVDVYQGATLVITDAVVNAPDTTYTATGLITETMYSFKVTAENTVGESAESNEIFVETLPTIPLAPTGLDMTTLTDNSFLAVWNASVGATEYFIDVFEQGGAVLPNFQNVQVLAPTVQRSITGLEAGKTYYFQVRAKNTGGTSANAVSTSKTLVPPTPEATSATSRVINGVNSSFKANWRAATGASDYRLLIYTYSNNTRTYLPNYTPTSPPLGNVVFQNIANVDLVLNKYYYRVIAKNDAGESAPSDSIVVESANMPNIPTSLSLFNDDLGKVEVKWQDNSDDEEGFDIMRAEDELFTVGVQTIQIGSNNTNTPQILRYIDTGLTPNKKYWYKVRATTASINSNYTLPESITTTPDAPNAPEDLFAVADGLTSIYLNWDDMSSDEGGFRIFRGLGEIGEPFALAGSVGAGVTEFIDTGLLPNTLYKYVVVSFKENQSIISASEPTNVAFARTADVPKVPTNVVAQAVSKDVINLTWTDNATNEDEFVIEASSVETDDIFEVVKVVNANITSFQFTATDGVKANHLYKFRMFARNDAGRSRYSNSDTTLTKIDNTIAIPNAPSGLVAESVSTIEIKLRWQDNSPNEDYFIIERSVGSSANFTELVRIGDNITNLSDLNVEEGEIYYYRIMAVNGGGKSAPSNIAFTEAVCNPIMVLVPDNPSGSGAVVCDSKHVELTLNTNVTAGEFYWYRNDELIPNAHLTRYVATETGEYYCRVIAGNCDKSTPVVSVIVNPSFSVGVNFDNVTSQLVANYTGADKYQWYYNYNPITGANAQTYKPTALGMYYVVITEGACSATSNPYPLTNITAVENWDISSQINVFPNPAKAQEAKITIDNGLLGEVEIRLIDQYGKVHQSIKTRKDAHAWQYKMDLNKMSTGLYIIDVRFGKYAGKRKLSIVE